MTPRGRQPRRPGRAPGEGLGPTPFSLLLGSLIGFTGMGSASVAVALPDLVRDLGVSADRGAWVISAYAITMAVGTGLYGRAGDTAGPRTPLAVGIGLLTAGALFAAAAPGFGTLVVARAVQGCGAGAAPVLAFALLRSKYDEVTRARALGNIAATTIAGMALGPLAGGLLTEAFGWRAAIVPPAAAAVALALLWRSLPNQGHGSRLDYPGAFLVAGASTGLVLLVQSPALGTDALLVGIGLVGVLGPLVARQVVARPTGFLPRAVVTEAGVLRSSIGAAAMPAAWFGLLVAMPAVLTERGWSALEVGAALLPGAVAGALVSRQVGRILTVFGSARALTAAAFVCAAGVGVAAIGAAGSPVLMILGMAAVYGAFAVAQPAMSAAIARSVPPDLAGIALGVATLVFFLGGGTGAAVAGLGPVFGWPTAIVLLAALPVAFGLAVRRPHRPSP
ncbi:MFS transporter [Nocardioides pakistanensis]